MESYVLRVKRNSDGTRIVTRYSLGESIFIDIIKLIFYVFVLWPLELFVILPIRLLILLFLIVIEFIIRGLFWLIKLPFCLLFLHRLPEL